MWFTPPPDNSESSLRDVSSPVSSASSSSSWASPTPISPNSQKYADVDEDELLDFDSKLPYAPDLDEPEPSAACGLSSTCGIETTCSPWMLVFDLDDSSTDDVVISPPLSPTSSPSSSSSPQSRKEASPPPQLSWKPSAAPAEWQDVYDNGLLPYVSEWFQQGCGGGGGGGGSDNSNSSTSSKWSGHLPLHEESSSSTTPSGKRRSSRTRIRPRTEKGQGVIPSSSRNSSYFYEYATDDSVEMIYYNGVCWSFILYFIVLLFFIR